VITLARLDLSRHIEFMVGDADASCQKLVDAGSKFHFAFVNHSHTYDDVAKACRRLSQLLTPRIVLPFHDYNSRWEGTAGLLLTRSTRTNSSSVASTATAAFSAGATLKITTFFDKEIRPQPVFSAHRLSYG